MGLSISSKIVNDIFWIALFASIVYTLAIGIMSINVVERYLWLSITIIVMETILACGKLVKNNHDKYTKVYIVVLLFMIGIGSYNLIPRNVHNLMDRKFNL